MRTRKSRKRKLVAKYLAIVVALVLTTLGVEFMIFGFPADKNSMLTLLFLDGIGWIGLGALIGGGFADSTMVGRINPAASPITGESLSRGRLQEREKELNSSLGMMVVGLFFLLLYVIMSQITWT
jgi:hypothetical protein